MRLYQGEKEEDNKNRRARGVTLGRGLPARLKKIRPKCPKIEFSGLEIIRPKRPTGGSLSRLGLDGLNEGLHRRILHQGLTEDLMSIWIKMKKVVPKANMAI